MLGLDKERWRFLVLFLAVMAAAVLVLWSVGQLESLLGAATVNLAIAGFYLVLGLFMPRIMTRMPMLQTDDPEKANRLQQGGRWTMFFLAFFTIVEAILKWLDPGEVVMRWIGFAFYGSAVALAVGGIIYGIWKKRHSTSQETSSESE